MQKVQWTSDSEQFEIVFERLCWHQLRSQSKEQYNRMSLRTSKNIDLMFFQFIIFGNVISFSAKSTDFRVRKVWSHQSNKSIVSTCNGLDAISSYTAQHVQIDDTAKGDLTWF